MTKRKYFCAELALPSSLVLPMYKPESLLLMGVTYVALSLSLPESGHSETHSGGDHINGEAGADKNYTTQVRMQNGALPISHLTRQCHYQER